jgi:hypothetical protein
MTQSLLPLIWGNDDVEERKKRRKFFIYTLGIFIYATFLCLYHTQCEVLIEDLYKQPYQNRTIMDIPSLFLAYAIKTYSFIL